MGLTPFVAIVLVVVTVVASMVTSQRLGEERRIAFQLQMQAEKLRRRLTDLRQDSKKAEGLVRALMRQRTLKQKTLTDLFDQLREPESDGKAITVAAGLQQHSYEPAEIAA